MPLRIYRSRQLSASNMVVLLVGATSFGMWFFLSLYLQQVLGYSAIRAGLAFLPMACASSRAPRWPRGSWVGSVPSRCSSPA